MDVRTRRTGGYTLIELLVAVVIGAIVIASLDSVVSLGLQAQAWGRTTNDLGYQGRHALERIAASARAVAPQVVAPPPVKSSGNWFAPTLYCVNGAAQLIETTTADAGCTGTRVLASAVSAFAVQVPPSAGPVDDPAALVSLALADANSGQTVSLATSVRLGGGER